MMGDSHSSRRSAGAAHGTVRKCLFPFGKLRTNTSPCGGFYQFRAGGAEV